MKNGGNMGFKKLLDSPRDINHLEPQIPKWLLVANKKIDRIQEVCDSPLCDQKLQLSTL